MFSGIGSEGPALRMLASRYETSGSGQLCFAHVDTFEIRPAARDTLAATTDAALFGDILSLLPLSLPTRSDLSKMDLDKLQRGIIADRDCLAEHCVFHRAQALVQVDLSDLRVSGVPCVDFSPMGPRKGLS